MSFFSWNNPQKDKPKMIPGPFSPSNPRIKSNRPIHNWRKNNEKHPNIDCGNLYGKSPTYDPHL